jgi:CPA1 family monovalent cation:H+ antiporter
MIFISLASALADRIRAPLATLLVILGVLLGLAGLAAGHSIPIAEELLGATVRLAPDGHELLYLFLPPLLFETAIGVNVRRLGDDIAIVVLLAVGAVFLTIVSTGLSLFWVSGAPLLVCLIIGVLLATPDHVAVVAVLREVQAPRRLELLLEGEGLFNDAAAITVFTLLLGMLEGEAKFSVVEAARSFVLLAIGGAVFGYIGGRAICLVLPWLRDLRFAELTLTVGGAYMIYAVGEHFLEVSGVVATAVAGLVVGYNGPRLIRLASWESFRSSWETLGFWGSALVFVLAAVQIPSLLRDATPWHFALVGIVVIAVFGMRALVMFVVVPFLSAVGLAHPIERRFGVIIVWGGLRGAVSLALTLATLHDNSVPPEQRGFIGIIATGFVLFTLFVNAPTLRLLMHSIGLDKLSPIEIVLRDRVIGALLRRTRATLDDLARTYALDDAARDDVDASLAHRLADIAGEAETINLEAGPKLVAFALAAMQRAEHSAYLELFQKRAVSRNTVQRLLAHSLQLSDAVRVIGEPTPEDMLRRCTAVADRLHDFGLGFRAALLFDRRLGISRFLAYELSARFEYLLAERSALNGLLAFNEERIVEMFGKAAAEETAKLVKHRLEGCQQSLDAIRLQYPKYAEALSIRLLTLISLQVEHEEYERLLDDAVITQEVFSSLLSQLSKRRRYAERRPPLDLGLDPRSLIRQVEFFRDLTDGEQTETARLLRPMLVVPGEMVLRAGDRAATMYFISSGAVEVKTASGPIRLGSGQVLGEYGLLTGAPRTADVQALSYCMLLSLSRSDLERIFAINAAVRERVVAVARERFGAGIDAALVV